MESYQVKLESPVFTTFRCQKAADSLDIDARKKSIHRLSIEADIESEYSVGLIVGSSGSGKTTLAQSIWGEAAFKTLLKMKTPVLEQFPKAMSYDDCVALLTGIGLTAVPCWIRPAVTLSNGQRARAEIALHMSRNSDPIVIDEWTSVVDRTVAKVMSHAVQKFVRRHSKRVVLCSCHYDVIEWLNPDWIIDCNTQTFKDRRHLRRRQRKEKLTFEIRRVERNTWRHFSRYHYLNERLPGGHIECFGLFHGQDQIGFECFANYVPWKKAARARELKKMHSNRCVIHPDYVGFGLGLQLINACCRVMVDEGYDVWAKLSAQPLVRARAKEPDLWALRHVRRQIRQLIPGGKMIRKSGFRQKVKIYSYQWIGGGT